MALDIESGLYRLSSWLAYGCQCELYVLYERGKLDQDAVRLEMRKTDLGGMNCYNRSWAEVLT